jgi:hypothetical protein
MHPSNRLAVLLIVVLGLAQAWDAHVFEAGPLFVGVVLAAIAAPALSFLVTERTDLQAGSVVLSFVLTLGARIFSETPLRDVLFVSFVPGMLLFYRMLAPRSRSRTPAEG